MTSHLRSLPSSSVPSPSPSRPGATTGSTSALQGALLAFHQGSPPRRPIPGTQPTPPQPRPKPQTKPKPTTSSRPSNAPVPTNATPLEGSPSRSDGRLSTQATGHGGGKKPPRDISPASDTISEFALKGRISPVSTGGQAPRTSAASLSGSPARNTSFIAATLAASRSPSPAPRRAASPVKTGHASERTDTSSLKPATALISMFEGGGQAGDPVKVDSPKRGVSVRKPQTLSARGSEERIGHVLGSKQRTGPGCTALAAARQVARVSPANTGRSMPSHLAPQPSKRVGNVQRPPTPPKPRGNNLAKLGATTSASGTEPSTAPVARTPTVISTTRSPLPTNLQDDEDLTLTRRDTNDTSSSHDTFVSASSVQSPSPPPSSRSPSHTPQPPTRTSTSTSPALRPAPPPRRKPGGTTTPSLGATALSNAIVAGSLASARLTPSNTGDTNHIPSPRPHPSPRLLQTLRPPQNPHHSGHHHHHKGNSPDEIDHEKRHKRSRLPGKKHAHHEGSRKRWRDGMTEAQKRRYEAVWASNKEILLDRHVDADGNRIFGGSGEEEGKEGEPGDGYVVNVVVREIWRRSRLPSDELEEVWDLVDRGGKGVLGRREFVVGMWLVDQRLRGRKIPARVGESVWDSACGVVMKRK